VSDKAPNVRASGFYWVRENGTANVFIAKWIDGTQSWVTTGWDGFLPDDEVTVLTPRLEPPTT
jgi:hypothetical protein